MTLEQNIFVVKRNIIDYIWKDANLEGIAITYPDTEAIFNGLSIQGYKVNDIVAVNNLKHAWQFLLDNIDYPFICELNRVVGGDNLVARAGFIRSVPVRTGGTSGQPDSPIESQIKEELGDIEKISNPTERAITLMLYGMRKQMFLDGNKRTSMLAANQIMISNGAGVLVVPIEKQRDFTKQLVHFYETGKMEEIKAFVYDTCIDGMEFSEQHQEQRPKWKKHAWENER